MTLSTKAKESIKTGLAMTLAYGIALSAGWDKPMWAGFAVAFCSLSTFGQSMNKAALRMLGTLVAAFMALAIFAFFIQQRWLFMLALSLWAGFCTYMMGGAKNQYFWHVCGFVCVIICFDSSRDSADVFATAVLRAEQTGLGILVYSLVAILIWPVRSGAQFEKNAIELISSQHTLYRACFDLMLHGSAGKDHKTLRSQQAQTLNHFQQLLGAAEIDTYGIREQRQQWYEFQDDNAALDTTLEEWRTYFNDLKKLPLRQLVVGLEDFDAEQERRFLQIEGMLKKQQPEHLPIPVNLVLDRSKLIRLTDMQKAALAVNLKYLGQIDLLTRSLFSSLHQIRGFAPKKARRKNGGGPGRKFVVDPDRMVSFFRTMSILWAAYLALIFVNDIPGGTGLVSMSGGLGMAVASMPQLPVSALFGPSAFGIFLAGSLYIFVMPHLTTFLGLGILLFAATFFFCYFFAAPSQALVKALGIALFVSIASISNQQSYSFLVVANTSLMFAILLLILSIVAHFPFNPRPEQMFMRLVTRFYTSCEYLLSTLEKKPATRQFGIGTYRRNYHLRVVSVVPGKLAMWSQSINTKILPGCSPQQVEAIVASIQVVAHRVKEVVNMEDDPQSARTLQELMVNRQDWYSRIRQIFGFFSCERGGSDQEELRKMLTELGYHFESRIKEILDGMSDDRFSLEEGIHFYSFLGANRGLCAALLDHAGSTGAIDWDEWRQPRF